MMSSASKKIGKSDAVVKKNISSPDDNDDISASAETCEYETWRQLEDTGESKKLLGSSSDAYVSNFSSSDSTQTVTEADVDQKSEIGSKLQKSQEQNFERMKFEEACQVKLDDDEDKLSIEKESKLCVMKVMESPTKPKCDAIETTDSGTGCSSEHSQILKTGSKRTPTEFDKQVDSRYSSCDSAMISVQDIMSQGSNIVEKPREVATKKIISKKFPEKFEKTRLGSSEVVADIIEDAIDHTDDSVFGGSSDFIISNIIPNTEIVTDITEDAIDNTDQEVFKKISSDPVFTDVSNNIIRGTGKVTDVTKDFNDQADETISLQVKFSDFVGTADYNILHKTSCISPEDTKRTVQVHSNSQTLDFQEVISGNIFSATDSTIFSQVSQIEGENVSDITTESLNLQNIDIEKTQSSIDSNHSDDRMEFGSASSIPSGVGYNTDIEKMECSSDTYSGFESFKIDGESNTTLEKMDCKSESSTSRDKMETESLSLKSNETDGMEYSSESMGNFEQKSISIHEYEIICVQSKSTSVQEKEFISLQESQSILIEKNVSTSVQEKNSINVHGNESVVVQESESIGVQENESITVKENKSIYVPESKLISVHNNESISVQENESISNQQTESISVQENESINILQEYASAQLLESVSCLIGDFVSRTIQETVSQQPQETLLGLLDEATTSPVLTGSKYTSPIESDSSSNEIKAIYESNTDPGKCIERNFTIPRKEASDSKEYDYEQKKVSDKEVDEIKLSSHGESSLKRRNSTEDEQSGKTTDFKRQSTSSTSELPDEDSEELKDGDDKKGHKKLRK